MSLFFLTDSMNTLDRVKSHELTKYNFVKFMIRQVQTSIYKLDPAVKSGNELISCKYHFLLSCMLMKSLTSFSIGAAHASRVYANEESERWL